LKKLLVIIVLALLIASVMLATAGCGDSDGSDSGENGSVMNGTMNGENGGGERETDYSAVGTYESDEGKFITLNADGTFETDDWDALKGGTYEFTQDQEGYYWVELTFEDGSLAVLSVIIAMDEVAAIVDDFTMVQYTKQ
jgi:hypothetical protein